MKSSRRKFIKTTALTAAAISSSALIASCGKENKNAPAVISNKKFEWKMVTSWPPNFPVLGDAAKNISKWIETASNGRLKIDVYGGGELVPPLEVFDAVSSGIAEMGHAAPYYWAGKIPSAQLFSALPFGMNTYQTNSWFYFGDGLKLWEEIYLPHNIVPFPAGNTGGQMGGWFNREISSPENFKGLKMRIPGLGGRVVTKLGATTVLSPGSELYTNLERGVIDALEWVGPYHDYLMGFHQIAKYYYYPGWHEPTGVLELMVNKSKFDSLPSDLQEVIKLATKSANILSQSELLQKNFEYLEKIKNEGKVFIKEFPAEVIVALKNAAAQVMKELSDSDKSVAKVFNSYKNFQQKSSSWSEMCEKNYL